MHCTSLFIHKTTLITQIPLVNELPWRVWPIWIVKYPNGHSATDHWLSIGEKEGPLFPNEARKWIPPQFSYYSLPTIHLPPYTQTPILIYPNPHSHLPNRHSHIPKPPFSYTQTPILIYQTPNLKYPTTPIRMCHTHKPNCNLLSKQTGNEQCKKRKWKAIVGLA
jgi:hypothetical protein